MMGRQLPMCLRFEKFVKTRELGPLGRARRLRPPWTPPMYLLIIVDVDLIIDHQPEGAAEKEKIFLIFYFASLP